MKRFLAILISAAMLLALPGCGGGGVSLLEGVAPAPAGEAADAAPLAADFTMKLFNAAYEGGDALISPVSVLAALAMAEAGARGNTLAQMEETFGVDAETLRLALAAYMAGTAGTEAQIANAIWFRDDGTFAPDGEFLSACASFADAEVFGRAFDEGLKGEINGWIEDNTDGMIKDMLDSVNPAAVMYLVNAIAFDAVWEEKYEPEQLREGVFNSDTGPRDVQMMYSDESLYLEGEGFTGFVKPYRGGRYAFAALLPEGSLSSLTESLTGEALAAALENASAEQVRAGLPAFEGRTSLMLNSALAAMGITDAFDADLADFTGMGESSDGSIFISQVLHEAYIEVTAQGTRAAAATIVAPAAGAEPPSEPKTVILDRPFAYMIVDTEYNIPLFFGVMTGAGL